METNAHIARGTDVAAATQRLDQLGATATQRSLLLDEQTQQAVSLFARNIENAIGSIKIPLGVAGPLRIRSMTGERTHYVPLATTEAALVASYSRGAQLVTDCNGFNTAVTQHTVSRSPVFIFESLRESMKFCDWLCANYTELRHAAQQTTRHGDLHAAIPTVEGNHVYVQFRYSTGEAAGQNMVTIATHAACKYIEEHANPKPLSWCIEGNFSADKKATVMSLLDVRGKRVCAETVLPAKYVEDRLHTTPEALARYWTIGAIGGAMSGQIGIQGHYANALAALYLACGQDVACVAESAIGITRFEVRENRDLYACVTLPNVIVGTVGGGTGLPTQRTCLDLLDLPEEGAADALAEIAAALCLAGELSISAAICADHFAQAHQRLARG